MKATIDEELYENYPNIVHVHFDIEATNDAIVVNGKRMPVEYLQGYTYKLMRRTIRTNGTLTKFIEENAKFGELFFFDIIQICKHVIKYGKKV